MDEHGIEITQKSIEENYSKYKNLSYNLNLLLSDIEAAANVEIKEIEDFCDNQLTGNYYDYYVNSADKCITSAKSIKSCFPNMLSDLKSRISIVEEKLDYWGGLKGVEGYNYE